MNKISVLRNENGISQIELGKFLGVSTSTVAMWETGKRTPKLKTAYKVAQYFEKSIEEIFFAN